MEVDLTNLTDFQKDALREIGNIGAGNAATAFAQILDCKIDMTVPSVEVVPISEVPEISGDIEQNVVAILLEIMGEAPGNILFILAEESLEHLLKLILKKDEINVNNLDQMEVSAVKELGNILSGSYLNSINQMTNFNLAQSVPNFAHDMAGAILSTSMISLSEVSDFVLLIETEFLDGDNKIDGYFFLIPQPGSLYKIFESLGFGSQ